jgi:hypothetical protein
MVYNRYQINKATESRGNKMHDLMKEYEFCRDLVEGLFDLPTEISVKANSRLKKSAGRAKYSRRNGYYEYFIEIASFVLDDRYPIKDLRNTICHELIHIVDFYKKGRSSGHCGYWLECAKEFNSVYSELIGDIEQYMSAEECAVADKIRPKKTYICKCEKCNHLFKQKGYRAPKMYTHPRYYKHTHCGGLVVPLRIEG